LKNNTSSKNVAGSGNFDKKLLQLSKTMLGKRNDS
jgi:hypothetical protein